MENLYWIVAVIGGVLAIWWVWNSIQKEQIRLLKSEYARSSDMFREEVMRSTVRLGFIFFSSFFIAGLIVLWGYIILYRKGSPSATEGLLILSITLIGFGFFGLAYQIIRSRRGRNVKD
ncbi:MAG: hypothetical protein ACUVWP_08000 [bacterium]